MNRNQLVTNKITNSIEYTGKYCLYFADFVMVFTSMFSIIRNILVQWAKSDDYLIICNLELCWWYLTIIA